MDKENVGCVCVCVCVCEYYSAMCMWNLEKQESRKTDDLICKAEIETHVNYSDTKGNGGRRRGGIDTDTYTLLILCIA